MTRKEKRKLRKDKDSYKEYGFSDVILKPIDEEIFNNIIDKYLPKLFVMFEGLNDKRQQGKLLVI